MMTNEPTNPSQMAVRPCGGCGATTEQQRCVGCLHDFGTKSSAWVRTIPAPSPEEQEPVAIIGKDYRLLWADAGSMSEIVAKHGITVGSPLYAHPAPVPAVPGDVAGLIADAWTEAQKAMRKFPQPNYVISKVAEEAGEVVKAAIHCAEGREAPEAVRAEMVQCMAMLFRLYVEGDQVHGLAALTQPADASNEGRG